MKQIKIKLSEPIVKNDGQFAVHDPQRLEKEIKAKLRALEKNPNLKLEILVELTNIDKEGLKEVLELLQEHIPIKYRIVGLYSRWLPRDEEKEVKHG